MTTNKIISANTFKILLKIPNFTPKLGETGESLDYHFSFGEIGKTTDWTLKVLPKGDVAESRNFMSVFLIPQSAVAVQVNFKVSLIDSNGKARSSIKLDYFFDANHYGRGWSKFISRENLFDKKFELLKDDVLTLSGEIKLEFMENTKYGLERPLFQDSQKIQQILHDREFADLTIKVRKESLKVHKFLLAEASPVFHEKLKILKNRNVLQISNIRFEILEMMVNFLYDNEIEDIEKNMESLLDAAILYKMDRLKNYCVKYMKDNLVPENATDVLILAVKIESFFLEADALEFIGKNIKEVIQHNWEDLITRFQDIFHKVFSHCMKSMAAKLSLHYKDKETAKDSLDPPKIKIVQDFEYLFTDKSFADVELKVDEKVLKVHKAILFSRSAVFRAMFQHGTLEAAKNEVVITDFDFETIQELVRFIYCQKVLNLDKVALNLLPAADKYELLDLKEMCAKSLGNNLTVENVLKCLKLANMHDCAALEKKAVAHIGRNVLTVTENSKWQEFIETNLELANEMFMEWVNALY